MSGTTGSQNQWRSCSGMTLLFLLLETKWPTRIILLKIIITESQSVFSKNHHYVVRRTLKVVGESVAVRRTDCGCCCCCCCGSMRVIDAFYKFAVVTVCVSVCRSLCLSRNQLFNASLSIRVLLVFVLRSTNILRK